MRNKNVIIIGSGVAGLAASLFLKKVELKALFTRVDQIN
nr:FAD-binding protein [Bacillus pumilus]